jgi:carbon storage regulator
MLVLTRKPGERIVLGDSIHVTVISLERGRVRLGVEAPPEVCILRQELQKGSVARHPGPQPGRPVLPSAR